MASYMNEKGRGFTLKTIIILLSLLALVMVSEPWQIIKTHKRLNFRRRHHLRMTWTRMITRAMLSLKLVERRQLWRVSKSNSDFLTGQKEVGICWWNDYQTSWKFTRYGGLVDSTIYASFMDFKHYWTNLAFYRIIFGKRQGLVGRSQGAILNCEWTMNPTTEGSTGRVQTARTDHSRMLRKTENLVGWVDGLW